jgi:hypothetical protein
MEAVSSIKIKKAETFIVLNPKSEVWSGRVNFREI